MERKNQTAAEKIIDAGQRIIAPSCGLWILIGAIGINPLTIIGGGLVEFGIIRKAIKDTKEAVKP